MHFASVMFDAVELNIAVFHFFPCACLCAFLFRCLLIFWYGRMSSSMPGDKGCTTPQDPSWLPSGFKAQLLPDGNLTVHDVSAEVCVDGFSVYLG